MKRTIFGYCASFLICSSPALALSGDADGDAVSDIPLIQIQNSDLNWSLFSPQTGSTSVQAQSFGSVGHHITYAPWTQQSRAELGYVELSDNDVRWTVRSIQGTTASKTFGIKKDRVVSGGDFNGNSIADAALVRVRGKMLRWRIAPDFFSASSSATKTIRFGNKGDTAIFVSRDGVSDQLAVLRASSNGSITLVTRSLNRRRATTTELGVLPFAKAPLPVAQVGAADLLVFIDQTGGSSTELTFVSLAGVQVQKTSFNVSGEVLVGEFIPEAPGEEVAIQGPASFVFYNPANGAVREVSAPSGIPIDTVNINAFESNGGGCNPKHETLDPYDGNEGFLWKPESDSDGKLAVLAPSRYTGQVQSIVLLAPGGASEIETGRYGGVGNGTRTHARFSRPGGSYPVGVVVKINLTCGSAKYVIQKPGSRVD